MSLHLQPIVQRLENNLSSTQFNWLNGICDAGMIYRINKNHPILAKTKKKLQTENIDIQKKLQQLPIHALFADFYDDLQNNILRLDKICAAAHWLENTQIIKPYIDLLQTSIHDHPEPWIPLAEHAWNVLQIAPPYFGDPARPLWVTIHSAPLIPTISEQDLTTIESEETEQSNVIQLFLPSLKMAADDGEGEVELYDICDFPGKWAAHIRTAGHDRDLIIQPIQKTNQIPTVLSNGVPQQGTKYDLDHEYSVNIGRWTIQFLEEEVCFDIKEQ